MWTYFRWMLLAVVPWTAIAQASRATTNLNLELGEIAKDIKKLLDGRGDDAITIGAFTGPAHLESSSGPVIAQVLSDELKKIGISVKRRANLEIKGDYLDVIDKVSQRLAGKLKARIMDRAGTVIVEFERGVFGDATLGSLFGVTAQLPPNGNDKSRDQAMRDGIDNPRVHFAGNEIATAPNRPFAIEVLVKSTGSDYQSRTPKTDNGLAFVGIQRGESYAIRLVNRASHEVAVTLTIDGLNMFAFSNDRNPQTGATNYTQIIVDPNSSVLVKGWYRTDDESEEFLVTEYSKSAAVELNSAARIGTITASFAASWPKGSPPPPDEPKNPSDFARSADATGRGPKFQEKYTSVERNFGVVRDTISVRYTK